MDSESFDVLQASHEYDKCEDEKIMYELKSNRGLSQIEVIVIDRETNRVIVTTKYYGQIKKNGILVRELVKGVPLCYGDACQLQVYKGVGFLPVTKEYRLSAEGLVNTKTIVFQVLPPPPPLPPRAQDAQDAALSCSAHAQNGAPASQMPESNLLCRVRERTIGNVVEILKKFERMLMQEQNKIVAAEKIDMKFNTLKDYKKQVQRARETNFDFDMYHNQGMGYLRKWNDMHHCGQDKKRKRVRNCDDQISAYQRAWCVPAGASNSDGQYDALDSAAEHKKIKLEDGARSSEWQSAASGGGGDGSGAPPANAAVKGAPCACGTNHEQASCTTTQRESLSVQVHRSAQSDASNGDNSPQQVPSYDESGDNEDIFFQDLQAKDGDAPYREYQKQEDRFTYYHINSNHYNNYN